MTQPASRPFSERSARVANMSSEGRRGLFMALLFFLVVGSLITLINLDLPITRNALTYAKAAVGIIQHHFNPFPVAHDASWTSGKPIFFSFFAAPFVWAFGVNAGTIVASLIGTVFFLWTVWLIIPRISARAGVPLTTAPLQFVLTAFNPLVIYQFWSAYPDSLLAGLILLAFVLSDIIATEPERDTRWHVVGLGVVIFIAMHAKLYGAVLGLLCPLYLLTTGASVLRPSRYRAARLAVFVIVFALLAIWLALAKMNINPLLDLAPEDPVGGGFTGYISGLLNPRSGILMQSVKMIGLALLLNFHFALLFILMPAAWRAFKLAPTLYALLYLLGLVTFGGTSYNMRYFLPVFPFVALPLAAGAYAFPAMVRRGILVLYGVLATVLVLNYNVRAAERVTEPIVDKLIPPQSMMAMRLDNLRLPAQLAFKQQIDAINAGVPKGKVVYWSSSYYKTATHGIAKGLGVREDLDVRYVLDPTEVPHAASPIYLSEYTGVTPPEQLYRKPEWANAERVGYGLFRLDPIQAQLSSLSGDHVAANTPIRLNAQTVAGDSVRVNGVDLLESDSVVATDDAAPFEFMIQKPSPGRHELVARVRYGEKSTLESDPVVVYSGTPAFERTIRHMSDQAAEMADGSVYPAYARADLGVSAQGDSALNAMRFANITVPRGARVARAYVQFTAAMPDSQPAELIITAEATPDAPSLRGDKRTLSARPKTTASVIWKTDGWLKPRERGDAQKSPDLGSLLEQVFAQEGWQPGNAVVLFVRGKGRRAVRAPSPMGGEGAPTLYVELR
jgi:hypothetical protein